MNRLKQSFSIFDLKKIKVYSSS